MRTSTTGRPRRMGLLDATFLNIETRETPMHVAALQVYRLPGDAPTGFVRNVVRKLRAPDALQPPWNLKLANVWFSRLAPAAAPAAEVDMDYHVRHSALPAPGGERELGELVSHLHSETLDRSRPLWTCHVIEGLSDGRFAIYVKMHHALTDGINGIRMVTRCLATQVDGDWCAPWHYERPPRKRPAKVGGKAAKSDRMRVRDWPRVLSEVARFYRRRAGDAQPVRVPFEAPRSALNRPVTAARRVATQQIELERVRRVAKRYDVSVNDVFLAVCSAALRRHLQASGELPEQSMIAGVPVSLRELGDESGNAVGFIWTSLATEVSDPRERLAAINASMDATKTHLRSLPAKLRPAFTMGTMTPAITVLMSGQGARLRPPMNVTISNVPGPEEQLYLGGAQLEALYPVSIAFQGQGLNITCISFAGQLNIGFTGSRDSLPHLQKIAVYTSEALDELENVLLKEAS